MIKISALRKSFTGKASAVLALDSIDADINQGEFFVLLGPSGSGKTTLLRCVAGLETPDGGEMHIGPQLVFSGAEGVCVPAESRKLGMVFQSYAIWPHMTVFENVALPLREGKARIPKHLIKARVHEALRMVGLGGLESRPAPLLSGGQQQRVALARSLAVEPVVLLMDEPLSNLDARLREEVRREIKALTAKSDVTTLYVTHDQEEAMELADRIAVMDGGRILQIGTPEELYNRPSDPRVAQFLGVTNWLKGKVVSEGLVNTEIGHLRVGHDRLSQWRVDDAVTIGMRTEDVALVTGRSAVTPGSNVFDGHVVAQSYLGEHRLYRITVGEMTITAKSPSDRQIVGEVRISVDSARVLVFPETGQAGLDFPGLAPEDGASDAAANDLQPVSP